MYRRTGGERACACVCVMAGRHARAEVIFYRFISGASKASVNCTHMILYRTFIKQPWYEMDICRDRKLRQIAIYLWSIVHICIRPGFEYVHHLLAAIVFDLFKIDKANLDVDLTRLIYIK